MWRCAELTETYTKRLKAGAAAVAKDGSAKHGFSGIECA